MTKFFIPGNLNYYPDNLSRGMLFLMLSNRVLHQVDIIISFFVSTVDITAPPKFIVLLNLRTSTTMIL